MNIYKQDIDIARDILKRYTGHLFDGLPKMVAASCAAKEPIYQSLENLGAIDGRLSIHHTVPRKTTEEMIAIVSHKMDCLRLDVGSSSPFLFRNFVYDPDFQCGFVQEDSLLLEIKGIRKGMKLTRALCIFLKKNYGFSEGQASVAVDQIASSLRKDKHVTLTLSVNPLDFILMSDMAAFTTCFRLEGSYRLSPYIFLQDNNSVLAYLHSEHRPLAHHVATKSELIYPYKLWRQLVFLDAERESAYRGRSYGKIDETSDHQIESSVARLLDRLNNRNGTSTFTSIPFHASPYPTALCGPTGEHGLPMYIDAIEKAMILNTDPIAGKVLKSPRFRIPEIITCPQCGDEHPIKSFVNNRMFCPSCDPNYVMCVSCERRVNGARAVRIIGPDTAYVCHPCISKGLWKCCNHCGLMYRNPEEENPTRRNYCHLCLTGDPAVPVVEWNDAHDDDDYEYDHDDE